MAWPRPAIVLVLIALLASGAEARRKPKPKAKPKPPPGLKVRIETEPPGATVYLGDKDSEPAGTTPLELTLPEGDQVVIVELEGYVDRFETITVEDSDLTQTFAYAMSPATATLTVQATPGTHFPKGTHVIVDGDDKGEAPVQAQVEVGAHEVQVTAPGKQPFDEWVQVDGGEQVENVSPDQLGGDVAASGGGGDGKHHRADQPYGDATAGVQIGWRRFRYDAPRTTNLLPYDGNGNAQFLVDAELYPWRRYVANRVLDHLSLTAGAGYAPAIRASNDAGMTIDAYWRSQHAGLRFHAGPKKIGVDVDVGWIHVLYTFRDAMNRLVDEVPDVDYQMLQLGARVIGRVGPAGAVELWGGADNRVVLGGGALGDRFRGSKVDGVAARAGVAAWFLHRHLEARVEGEYLHLGWTFQSQSGDTYDADGGTDAMYGLTIAVGGSY